MGNLNPDVVAPHSPLPLLGTLGRPKRQEVCHTYLIYHHIGIQ